MPQKPITVILFRCNACHTVHAVEANYDNDGRNARPGYDCLCGGTVWTQIKEVI